MTVRILLLLVARKTFIVIAMFHEPSMNAQTDLKSMARYSGSDNNEQAVITCC